MMKTDWRVWQEKAVAETFVAGVRPALLGGDSQIATMLQLLGQVPQGSGVVLDLGCGDGILLEAVLNAFPRWTGIAYDGSEAMLAAAKERFSGESRVDFVQGDFGVGNWRNDLPTHTFAAVISGFAIHHCEDVRKREIYQEIFGLLELGGAFINIEHVASLSSFGEDLFDRAMMAQVVRFEETRGNAVEFGDLLTEHRARPDRLANRLCPVETQMQWLRDIGYIDVDCYWKHYELAVFAGFKDKGNGK